MVFTNEKIHKGYRAKILSKFTVIFIFIYLFTNLSDPVKVFSEEKFVLLFQDYAQKVINNSVKFSSVKYKLSSLTSRILEDSPNRIDVCGKIFQLFFRNVNF